MLFSLGDLYRKKQIGSMPNFKIPACQVFTNSEKLVTMAGRQMSNKFPNPNA